MGLASLGGTPPALSNTGSLARLLELNSGVARVPWAHAGRGALAAGPSHLSGPMHLCQSVFLEGKHMPGDHCGPPTADPLGLTS